MATGRPPKKPKLPSQAGSPSASMTSPLEPLKELKSEEPVLQISLPLEDQAPPLDFQSPDTFFEAIVYPISPQEFLQHAFRKKALHITSAGVERLAPILQAMHQLDPAHILQNTSSEHVFVWLLDAATRRIQSIEVEHAETAIALHKAGHATYCRAPPEVEQPMMANLLRGTGMGCGQYDPSGERVTALGRGEVEVFLGTKSHTTDWHFDFQENFTLQLSGCKKWTLRQGTIQSPLRGCTPHYAAPEAVESQLKAAHLSNPDFCFDTPSNENNAIGDTVEVILQPGDMLYFPAGMWHKVETLQAGVSINVSLMAANYASIFCQALHHILLQDPMWREPVCAWPTSSGRTAKEHLESLITALPSMMERSPQIYGAAAVLPPVLCLPPDFKDDSQQENEESGTANGEMSEAGNDEVLGQSDEEAEPDSMDETVVDVNHFIPPKGWRSGKNGVGELVCNPLASLMRMKDLTGFYNSQESNDDEDHLYVLNVNYAGNDLHESAVRVVLQDANGNLEKYIDSKPRYGVWSGGDKQPWEECLEFYGFFLPCKKNTEV